MTTLCINQFVYLGITNFYLLLSMVWILHKVPQIAIPTSSTVDVTLPSFKLLFNIYFK